MRHKPAAVYGYDRKVSSAVREYALIPENAIVLVAFSGSRDSLPLLNTLFERQRYVQSSYKLNAALVYPDFFPLSMAWRQYVEDYCAAREIPLLIEPYTPEQHTGGRCLTCAAQRRKILARHAMELSCTHLATAHLLDDFVQAIIAGMFYSGQLKPMQPKATRGALTVIRPAVLCERTMPAKYSRAKGFPEFQSGCPHERVAASQTLRAILRELPLSASKVKFNIYRSIERFIKKQLDEQSGGYLP